MAEALETKKRRLTRLLDNLSSSDLNSKSPSTSTTSSAKRSLTVTERFEEARERASKRLRHSTSTGSCASLPTKVAHAKSVVAKNLKDGEAPPNFSPWSHELFLQRLKTFSSVSLWHPKPEGINEVEWAKRGWRCVDVNTVACKGGCERRVVVSLDAPSKRKVTEDPEDEDDEDDAHEQFEKALVERYKDVTAEGHAEHCMWRSSGCRDDIYRVQVIRPSVWQPELRKRCKSILTISPAVENVTFQALPTDGLKTQPAGRLTKDLPPDLTGTDAEDREADEAAATKALTVALHGWRGSREAGSDLLHCDACFQRIGLWMYQPDYKRTKPTSAEDEDDSTPTIDLTEIHREHCPWRNPSSQKSSGSLAGLNAAQILQRVVSTYARDVRRKSAEREKPLPQIPAQQVGEDEGEAELERATPKASREEIAKQDKERESRLRRLKSLFSVKRKGGASKMGAK